MFSTTIKVPVEVLQNNASKIIAFADDGEDIFDRILNTLLCMEGSGEWKGKSLTAAANATRANKEKYGEVIEEIRELGTFLRDFANAMEAKDCEIKAQIEAL